MQIEIKSLRIQQESYSNRKGEPYRDRNKLYIWPTGENVLENLFNRHNRPAKVWKEEVIPVLLERIQAEHPELFQSIKDANWGWRQKCGCTCPCSPGFVSDKFGTVTISAEINFSE